VKNAVRKRIYLAFSNGRTGQGFMLGANNVWKLRAERLIGLNMKNGEGAGYG